MSNTSTSVRRQLRRYIDREKAAFYPSFFKTGPGQYGEGDKFLGVVVPDQRRVAKRFRQLSPIELESLLADEFHECRLTAVFILTLQFENADDPTRNEIFALLLSQLPALNNWDIVDAAGPKILGPWLLNQPRHLLWELADSEDLWRQRLAIVACLPLIKNGELREIQRLARQFLTHPHDLIHKATGWMLREMGKVDEPALHRFLDRYAARMPRTMLCYSIERLAPAERKRYLAS